MYDNFKDKTVMIDPLYEKHKVKSVYLDSVEQIIKEFVVKREGLNACSLKKLSEQTQLTVESLKLYEIFITKKRKDFLKMYLDKPLLVNKKIWEEHCTEFIETVYDFLEKYSKRKNPNQLIYKKYLFLFNFPSKLQLACALIEAISALLLNPGIKKGEGEGIEQKNLFSMYEITLKIDLYLKLRLITSFITEIIFFLYTFFYMNLKDMLLKELKEHQKKELKQLRDNFSKNASFTINTTSHRYHIKKILSDSVFIQILQKKGLIDLKVTRGFMFLFLRKFRFIPSACLFDFLFSIMLTFAEKNKNNKKAYKKNEDYLNNIEKRIPLEFIYLLKELLQDTSLQDTSLQKCISEAVMLTTLFKKQKTDKNCLYYISLPLPTLILGQSLPMISPPKDWVFNNNNLEGGYLLGSNSLLKVKAVASKDYSSFNFKPSDQLLGVLNKMQKVPFCINASLLEWVLQNYSFLIKKNILTDPSLLSMNLTEACLYLKEDISFKNLQEKQGKARRELLTLRLAQVFAGTTFYIPAFFDYRGSIYRKGILSVQGTALSRNLILWDSINYALSFLKKTGDISTILQNITLNFCHKIGLSLGKADSLEKSYQAGKNAILIKPPELQKLENYEDPFFILSVFFVKKQKVPCVGNLDLVLVMIKS